MPTFRKSHAYHPIHALYLVAARSEVTTHEVALELECSNKRAYVVLADLARRGAIEKVGSEYCPKLKSKTAWWGFVS